jgi:hypothetical protein
MMKLSFANVRCAIDILRNRMPGSLAMLKATDIGISVHHVDAKNIHYCRVEFEFPDSASASEAYRAVERLYEMTRVADLARLTVEP